MLRLLFARGEAAQQTAKQSAAACCSACVDRGGVGHIGTRGHGGHAAEYAANQAGYRAHGASYDIGHTTQRPCSPACTTAGGTAGHTAQGACHSAEGVADQACHASQRACCATAC